MTSRTPSRKKATLPKLIDRKLYKTGQTRGADDDVIFQNRVLRNSTVLIPFEYLESALRGLPKGESFENGFIVLINPDKYFSGQIQESDLKKLGIELGDNALLFYETRSQWDANNPLKQGLKPGMSRIAPLGGHFIARVPSTTSNNKNRENHGYTTTKMKGAGIRVYEYASSSTIKACRIQLEFLFWRCGDSVEQALNYGMSESAVRSRQETNFAEARQCGLDDIERLVKTRILNDAGKTICPLCLAELSSAGFYDKVAQAEGRAVADLTVTQLNLFHIEELRTGLYNHRPYNLGWGHHHCNIVTKDSGIEETLSWMLDVLRRNGRA